MAQQRTGFFHLLIFFLLLFVCRECVLTCAYDFFLWLWLFLWIKCACMCVCSTRTAEYVCNWRETLIMRMFLALHFILLYQEEKKSILMRLRLWNKFYKLALNSFVISARAVSIRSQIVYSRRERVWAWTLFGYIRSCPGCLHTTHTHIVCFISFSFNSNLSLAFVLSIP